jgi:two-component system sensor histidine kinase UhpB
VREDERVAISRELHDDLGQALTAVKIDLGLIRQATSDSEIVSGINKVIDLVGVSIKTVQRLTARLRPQIIDDLGLEAAIEWYTSEFAERSRIKIALDIDPGINFSTDSSMVIFRIIQESLTNIARHSGAGKVEISLKKTNGSISLMISDDGQGISDDQIISNKSFGIMSMKERAGSLGGDFSITGDPGYGTVIHLNLPYTN